MTPEEIKELKAKHGRIFRLTAVDDAGNKFEGFVKTPDRKTLAAAMKIGKSDPMKFNEIILRNIWLSGDEKLKELNENEELLRGVYAQLGEVIKVTDVELEEL